MFAVMLEVVRLNAVVHGRTYGVQDQEQYAQGELQLIRFETAVQPEVMEAVSTVPQVTEKAVGTYSGTAAVHQTAAAVPLGKKTAVAAPAAAQFAAAVHPEIAAGLQAAVPVSGPVIIKAAPEMPEAKVIIVEITNRQL